MPPLAGMSITGDLLSWLGAVFFWATLMVLLWRRAPRQATRRGRLTDLLAATVCMAVIVGGVMAGVPDQPQNVWDTEQGQRIHAGFLTGCRTGAYGPVGCDCLFERLISEPLGGTPSGLTTLMQSMRDAHLARTARWLRPEAAAALTACRRNA